MPTYQELHAADCRRFAAQATAIGALWIHDGNPKRPYARLRSGLLSNAYFNGAKVCEYPALIETAGRLLAQAHMLDPDRTGPMKVSRTVGPAMGAITLAHAVARSLEPYVEWVVRTAVAEKNNDGFVVTRAEIGPTERILLVEDTVTTGGSVEKVVRALPEGTALPYLAALCNRSGHTVLHGRKVYALIEGDFRTWEEGDNPFSGGKELVAPVTNVKAHWNDLVRDYP